MVTLLTTQPHPGNKHCKILFNAHIKGEIITQDVLVITVDKFTDRGSASPINLDTRIFTMLCIALNCIGLALWKIYSVIEERQLNIQDVSSWGHGILYAIVSPKLFLNQSKYVPLNPQIPFLKIAILINSNILMIYM